MHHCASFTVTHFSHSSSLSLSWTSLHCNLLCRQLVDDQELWLEGTSVGEVWHVHQPAGHQQGHAPLWQGEVHFLILVGVPPDQLSFVLLLPLIHLPLNLLKCAIVLLFPSTSLTSSLSSSVKPYLIILLYSRVPFMSSPSSSYLSLSVTDAPHHNF